MTAVFLLLRYTAVKPRVGSLALGRQHGQVILEPLVSVSVVVTHKDLTDLPVQQLLGHEVRQEDFPVGVVDKVIAVGLNAVHYFLLCEKKEINNGTGYRANVGHREDVLLNA